MKTILYILFAVLAFLSLLAIPAGLLLCIWVGVIGWKIALTGLILAIMFGGIANCFDD
jgi:hypothetical protein